MAMIFNERMKNQVSLQYDEVVQIVGTVYVETAGIILILR